MPPLSRPIIDKRNKPWLEVVIVGHGCEERIKELGKKAREIEGEIQNPTPIENTELPEITGIGTERKSS